jgi:transposase
MSTMEAMERKQPRARRSFTPEFKAEIVELCQRTDRSIGRVARDFDLTETAVREWVRQAERDAGTRGDGGLTSAERQELSALRRENRRLQQDVEILKRATWRSTLGGAGAVSFDPGGAGATPTRRGAWAWRPRQAARCPAA